MRNGLKKVERWGRRWCIRVLGRLLAVRPRPPALPQGRPPRFLVVRLDARVGNLLLTTPLMLSLARRYPGCVIDCVAHAPAAALLRGLPFLHEVHAFTKWGLFGRSGAWQLGRRLRRARYDVCFDATNPSEPSVTQALVVRAVRARCAVGYAHPDFGRLYHAPVALPAEASHRWHEVDMRLALLQPLGPGPALRTLAVAPPWPPDSAAVVSFADALAGCPYVAINVGARLAHKRLGAADWAMVANACTAVGLRPVLLWGPKERHLLGPVLHLASDAVAAPPSTLRDLACLLRGAHAVITADTGPMHLAVALGRPTLGLFVATPRQRYGHGGPLHRAVDARGLSQTQLLTEVRSFLAARLPQGTAAAAYVAAAAVSPATAGASAWPAVPPGGHRAPTGSAWVPPPGR